MAIKSIVVHPKGATHKDSLDYWLKEVDGQWFFFCTWAKAWHTECLADVVRTPIKDL